MESAPRWEMFPWVLVRFATIPRSSLARTRLTETLNASKRVRGLRRELSASAELLSSRLYAVMPRLDARTRREALAARRAIFRLESPADRNWIDRLAEHDAGLQVDLEAWIGRRDKLVAAETERCALYDDEIEKSDHVLWSLLESPCFQRGLSLTNPLLAEHLTTLSRKSAERLSGRERQLRARAIRYLHRAALKPTPFGFFAGVALAQLGLDRTETALDVSRLVSSISDHAEPEAFTRDANAGAAVRHHGNIYLDPGVFQDASGVWAISRETGEPTLVDIDGAAADVFNELARSSPRGVPWHETSRRTGEEVLDRLLSAGVIGLDVGNQAPNVALPMGADKSQKRIRYEDAVHPTLLALRPDIFSGFLSEVVEYGATNVYPGLTPEQRGLSRVFAEVHGERRDVPLLGFFRDFLAVRREHGLDYLPINAAASVLGDSSERGLSEAAVPLAQALRRALCADRITRETALAVDVSQFSHWESVTSTRLSMLLTPGPGGLSCSRMWVRLWGADRMSLFPRYASSFASIAPNLIGDYRRFMRLWPETTDVWGGIDGNVDARPRVTHRTIDLPGCRPCPNGIPLRDLRIRLDSLSGRLTLTESPASAHTVRPVFLGVSSMSSRPLLYQFLEVLDGHRVSVFELLLRTLGRVLAEEAVWTQRGSVKHVPAVTLGEHVALCPEMARIETAAIPNLTSAWRRQAFIDFHDWWGEHELPLVAEVHVPRGAMRIDLGSPDGVRSFYGHICGAERVHILFPFTSDDNSFRSIDGESHEVEFALEIAAGRR